MTALLIGTALAVASLCYVLYPLYRADLAPAMRASRRGPRQSAAVAAPRVARQSPAVDALRELEFDRQTGKISDTDYEALKARYTTQALTAMRAGNAPVCEKCGPRPEADAEFCSSCGAAVVA